MPRKPRKEPTRTANPLDEYSTWDLRIAKAIYYSIIVSSATTILGIWLAIIGWLIEKNILLDMIAGWGPGGIALIVVGIVVLHMFLLVLFYTLFRGGILRLCQKLFKDRILARKYEDYTTLRLLLAVTLISVYIFLITLVVVIVPLTFWPFVAGIISDIIPSLNPGDWVLVVGLMLFVIVMLVYLGFAIWNHGVFIVLKRVKRIEEEDEIEEEIRREELKGEDDESLQKVYEKQTGKKAIYRGKETKAYKSWKRKMLS
jgi:hypothetical protein